MNRMLIIAVAALGFTGVAAAQEAPQLIGKLSPNVAQSYNRGTPQVRPHAAPRTVDRTRTGSVGARGFRIGGGQPLGGPVWVDRFQDDRYTGR
jgi:hypothetical protein